MNGPLPQTPAPSRFLRPIRTLGRATLSVAGDMGRMGLFLVRAVLTTFAPPLKFFRVLQQIHFNDKLYFWVLKPVSRGYASVMPMPARRGVRNFFSNLSTPARLVNFTLQADFRGAWVEIRRFTLNTTVGVAGFGDPALNRWNLEKRNEDLGQTLGRYGIGPSFYICWPILGPSSRHGGTDRGSVSRSDHLPGSPLRVQGRRAFVRHRESHVPPGG